jgi:hypothetical protein
VLRNAERRADPSRVQVGLNSFFAGPIDESDDAVKLRDRVRRSIHQMAASECTLVEQVLANACRLESINLYLKTRDIDLPGFLKPDPLVPLGICKAGDADGLGGDAEGCQEAAELLLGQRLAALPFRPGAFKVGYQPGSPGLPSESRPGHQMPCGCLPAARR